MISHPPKEDDQLGVLGVLGVLYGTVLGVPDLRDPTFKKQIYGILIDPKGVEHYYDQQKITFFFRG